MHFRQQVVIFFFRQLVSPFPHLPLLGPFDIFSVKYTRANYLSNCRESTVEFVERVGLSTLVDIVVCGDDQVGKFKIVECRHVHVCVEMTNGH